MSHFRSLRPGTGPRIKRNGSCIRAPELNQTIQIRLLETKSRKMVRRHKTRSVSVWNAKCIQMWQLVFFMDLLRAMLGTTFVLNSKDNHIWNYSETDFLRNACWKNNRSGTHEIVWNFEHWGEQTTKKNANSTVAPALALPSTINDIRSLRCAQLRNE